MAAVRGSHCNRNWYFVIAVQMGWNNNLVRGLDNYQSSSDVLEKQVEWVNRGYLWGYKRDWNNKCIFPSDSSGLQSLVDLRDNRVNIPNFF